MVFTHPLTPGGISSAAAGAEPGAERRTLAPRESERCVASVAVHRATGVGFWFRKSRPAPILKSIGHALARWSPDFRCDCQTAGRPSGQPIICQPAGLAQTNST
jgi:hypothetical protein